MKDRAWVAQQGRCDHSSSAWDVVCEADCTTGRPLRPGPRGPGSHAGSGPRGREAPPVSWGDSSLQLVEPAPLGGPQRGFVCQRRLPVSAVSCGRGLGQAAPSWRVPPSSIGRSWEMEDRAALIQAFGGNGLNNGGDTLQKVGETQSRQHHKLRLSIPTSTPNSEDGETIHGETEWNRGSGQ